MTRATGDADFYAMLGVPADAPEAEISRAFRRQAFIHHPDHGGDADAFRDLHRARETLLDPGHREAYDRQRRAADQPDAPRSATSGPDAGPGPQHEPAADPFEWDAGAGPGTGRWGHAAADGGQDPSPVYESGVASEPGWSWRRSERFAWWEPAPPPAPRRRRRTR